MNIAIIGSRNYPDKIQVQTIIRKLNPKHTIITGGAKGVDTWAEQEGRRTKKKVIVIKPDLYAVTDYYDACGRYYARNQEIVNRSDCVIAFKTKGQKGGTAHTIKYAQAQKKEVFIYER